MMISLKTLMDVDIDKHYDEDYDAMTFCIVSC